MKIETTVKETEQWEWRTLWAIKLKFSDCVRGDKVSPDSSGWEVALEEQRRLWAIKLKFSDCGRGDKVSPDCSGWEVALEQRRLAKFDENRGDRKKN